MRGPGGHSPPLIVPGIKKTPPGLPGGVFQVLLSSRSLRHPGMRRRAGSLIALLHRALAGELHAALVIDADALDPDHVADLDDILGPVDAEVREFGDMH